LQSEIDEKELLLLQKQKEQQKQEIQTQTWIITTVSVIALIAFTFFFNYRRNYKLATNQGRALNELNDVILAKNREIEKINKTLDHKLINMTKLLFESQKIAKLGSWEFNMETKEYHWTDETYRQLGLTPQRKKPSDKIFKQFVSPEDYQRLANAMNRTKNQGVISDETVKVTLETGLEKYIKIRYFAEQVKGKLVRVYGSSQDITDAVSTEQREKSIIQSLLELSRFSNLLQYDFEHFIKYLLKQATQTLDVTTSIFWIYNKETQTLQYFKSFRSPEGELKMSSELQLSEFPAYEKAIKENRTVPNSDLEKHESTKSIYEQFFSKHGIVSLLDAKVEMDGQLVGLFSIGDKTSKNWTFSDQRYVGSLTDIIATAYSTSQNKQLEREKGELINKLFKKNQNLEELAYVVSHNMRGPLTQIIGLSQLYNDPQSKGLESEIVQRIKESSFELDAVIKDLSEILKQQEDATELIEELPFKSLTEEVLKQVKSEFEDVDSKIQLSARPGLIIYGKKSQIQNIIYTLLSNSFKYRKKETLLEINVTARKRQNKIILSFADNGLGIDLKKYEMKVFRMYQRFHPEIEGTGIGLFIVKNQIEAMGGSIEVSSSPMDGTIFTIELPDHALISMDSLKLETA